MKKYLLILAGLILATSSISAQALDKEAQKALKAAQKEAESLVKKARSKYQGSIADPQMGRKETDFVRMQEALDLSNAAIANEHNAQNKEAWHTAADIEYCYYKKLEGELKTDESVKQQFLDCAQRLSEYCIKFDNLYNAEPKKNAEEYKKAHQLYQNYALNALIQILQSAQVMSSADDQPSLKKCVEYSTLLTKSFSANLFSDFDAKQVAEWTLYSKIFRAQALASVEGADATEIENAYMELKGSNYELIGYQALCNYFRDRNQDKYVEYLQKALVKAEGTDNYPQLLFMLMQHQYSSKQTDECLKTIALAKEKCAGNDNLTNAYLMEVQINFEREQFKEAENAAMEGFAKFPDEPKFLMMAARSSYMYYARHTEDKEALNHTTELFTRLESENPDDPELWGESLYILYNNSGQYEKAKAYKKYYKEVK